MPTSEIHRPANGVIGYNYPSGAAVTRCQKTDCRKRSWANTLNYWSSDRKNLPINSYVDEQWSISQPVMVKVETYSGSTLTARSWDGRDHVGLEQLIVDYAAIANSRVRSEATQINDTALKALVKIADAKVNIAVSLKEASKTSDLILDRANRIYRAYRSFRRGNFRDVARNLNLTPKTVHKTWLEYKYGWTPLLMEVKGAAEFFAQQSLGGRPPRFSVSAVTVDKTDKTEVGALEGWNKMTRTITYTRKCRVKIECEVSNPTFNQLQQLGVTNPLLYAWEIIPYSFVFDWFVSVGDYLTGISALHGITVRRSMQTWEKQLGWSRSGFQNPSGNIRAYESLITGNYRAYQRYAYSVDPSSYYPPLGNGLSFQKLVTGLALLRSNSRHLRV